MPFEDLTIVYDRPQLAPRHCEVCGIRYIPSTPGQRTCRRHKLTNHKEVNMRKERPLKDCVKCGKPFRPTGNCQKRCPDCSPHLRAKARKAGGSAKAPARVIADNGKEYTARAPAAKALARTIRLGPATVPQIARIYTEGRGLGLLDLVGLLTTTGVREFKRCKLEFATTTITIEPTEAA